MTVSTTGIGTTFRDENGTALTWQDQRVGSEEVGWFIYPSPTRVLPVKREEANDLSSYCFYTPYLQMFTDRLILEENGQAVQGDIVVFRLQRGRLRVQYLHLYHVHNFTLNLHRYFLQQDGMTLRIGDL